MKIKTDAVVFGESAEGIMAAVRVARQGKKVVLIRQYQAWGGFFPSLGAIETHYPGQRAPLLNEFTHRIKEHYRRMYGQHSTQYADCTRQEEGNPMITFEPHVAESILQALVNEEANIQLIEGCVLTAVERNGTQIHTLRLKSEEDNITVTARIFLDTTYTGDLIAQAGVPYRIGRESQEAFRETHAGKIFTHWVDGHFPLPATQGALNIIPKRTTRGLWEGSDGTGDDNIQSYSYRLCLSSDPDNRVLPGKPERYDRERYVAIVLRPEEIQQAYPLQHRFLTHSLEEMIEKDHLFHGHALPNNKRSWNATNFPGAGKNYPEGNLEQRQQIEQAHKNHALGILYFLQNDDAVPLPIRHEARRWGLATDEFADTHHLPPVMYIREARRIVGKTTLTERDCLPEADTARPPVHADAIAITEFPIDSLECTTERQKDSLCDGQFFLMEDSRPGQIPLGVLLNENTSNLLAPTSASTSHVAWGTLRQNATLMHLSEAAGFVAAMALDTLVDPCQLSTDCIQKTLVENGVMVSFFNDFDMNVKQPWVPAIQYLGTKGFFRSFDALPDAALDHQTAKVWIENAAHHWCGTLCPSQRAALLPDKPVAFDSLSVAEFLKQVKRTLEDFRLAAMVSEQFVQIPQHFECITRGQAAIILYNIMTCPTADRIALRQF